MRDLILLFDMISLPYKVARFLIENFSKEQLMSIKNTRIDGLEEDLYIKLKNAISPENIEKMRLKLQKYGISYITIVDKDYPPQLREISLEPLILYYRGNKELLSQKSIAIVGTRKPTLYGRDVTRLFARRLSEAGLVTVSGLAYGLDMEVALATLETKGKTIAVLGGGLDKIYPSQNTALAERIVSSGGLLLSLYPPLRRPTKYSFVERNRIITGLSLGTIIAEAGQKSGTLNTASHAIEQGKELFVIPANITSPASEGSNKLIEELPETFTISPERVLSVLKISGAAPKKKEIVPDYGDVEKQILAILYEGEADFDTLKEKTGLDSKSLIRKLTTMEISGLIKKLPSNFYSL